MIELLNSWTFFIVSFFYISYFYYLKYKTQKLLKQVEILEKFKYKESKETVNAIRELSIVQEDNVHLRKEREQFYIDSENFECEFKFYQKVNQILEKDVLKYKKISNKYRVLYDKCHYKEQDLIDDNHQINNDMDKMAKSYRDVFALNKTLINDNYKLVDDVEKLKNDICNLDAELFMYKSGFDTSNNRIKMLETVETTRKIEILKLRNIVKQLKKTAI
tara:strand:+ start:3163 stop:3819 length:657 start_codon:yes stop_codon:yes gene_type:complete